MNIVKTRKWTDGNVTVELKLVEGWNDHKTQLAAKTLLSHVIDNKGETIRYKDLARKVSFDCEAHFVDRFLGALSYSCLESGLPAVSVMVVNENQMPGTGFYEAYFPHLKKEEDRWKECFKQMKLVNEYKYWDIVLKLFTGEIGEEE